MMTQFSIKNRVEQNVTVWLLGTLLTGFLSGIGVYRAVQDMAGLGVVAVADLENLKRQIAEQEQKLVASEKRAATAAAQAKQAYWAVRGTQVTVLHAERNIEAAIELKERLAALGAVVMLKPQEAAEHAGKLYYGVASRDAAMQIKALVSDIALAQPEESREHRPGVVTLWLVRR